MEKIILENNQSACIVQKDLFTGTNYINICNGNTYYVPYNMLDITSLIFLGVSFLTIFFLFVKLLRGSL